MASAVLAANRNEPNWTQQQPGSGANFMGKVPFSNSNSNPKFSKKRQFHAPPVLEIDESPAITQSAASDDASSINRRPGDFNTGGYVTFNVASCSKKELIELKNRLVAELEQIRQLKIRIDFSESQINRSSSNFHNKKTTTTNDKKASGNKRPFPAATTDFGTKELKRVNPENVQLLKKCGQILTKLMKHKHGYIFNAPVDVVFLKLHDYYDVIKHPMDLGTVKSKLGRNLYDSPWDFAADVRLTFNNAMRYNPKGHEVYVLAEQLLVKFEELYRPIKEKVGEADQQQVQEVQASSWDHNRKETDRVMKEQGTHDLDMEKPEQIGGCSMISISGLNQNPNSNPQSTDQLPIPTATPPSRPALAKPVKQPKPKAKDPNKRQMTLEEKHKLGLGLQSLPQEKMEQVVQITRKRNGHLCQEGDEIELDIEAVDTETLWELDRLVTNYKKMVSKIKRQALLGINNGATIAASEGNKDAPGNERMDVVIEAKKAKKGDAGDEDVDIGDEMPMSSFPPVEIEKDNGHASSSSCSSSSSSSDDDSSSSSSDSDSGSSSGSDSEDAHS